jgi:hypothetical protein
MRQPKQHCLARRLAVRVSAIFFDGDHRHAHDVADLRHFEAGVAPPDRGRAAQTVQRHVAQFGNVGPRLVEVFPKPRTGLGLAAVLTYERSWSLLPRRHLCSQLGHDRYPDFTAGFFLRESDPVFVDVGPAHPNHV